MKKRFLVLPSVLLLLLATLTNCKKEKEKDLTTDIIGHYRNTNTDIDIIVNKVDDKTISFTIDYNTGSADVFASTTMNSATSFTLNKLTHTGYSYGSPPTVVYYDQENTGSGTYSANNISVTVHRKETRTGTTDILDEYDESYTAFKL